MNPAHIPIDDQPSTGDLDFLEAQLNRFNMRRVAAYDYRPLAAFVRENGAIVAGISGYTWGGMCEVQFLWVREDQRGLGLGSKLLAAAEHEARARGCTTIALSSYSFQAPEFYQHLGYQVAGAVPDCPPGFSNVYLYKRLAPLPG
jgi:GNAT superfamily N-acetyltransferase